MSTPNLKEFLCENKVYRQFCDNLKNDPSPFNTLEEFMADQKKKRTESDGITFAFLWADTPEGFHFWNELDTRFQRYYYRCKKDGKL